MTDMISVSRNKAENWLDILNYWFEHIEDYQDRYPDMKKEVEKFSKIIDEIYELTKQGANNGW